MDNPVESSIDTSVGGLTGGMAGISVACTFDDIVGAAGEGRARDLNIGTSAGGEVDGFVNALFDCSTDNPVDDLVDIWIDGLGNNSTADSSAG